MRSLPYTAHCQSKASLCHAETERTCSIELNLLKILYVASPVSREVIALFAVSRSIKSKAPGRHLQYPAASRVISSRFGIPLRATAQKSSFSDPALTPHGTEMTVGMVPIEERVADEWNARC